MIKLFLFSWFNVHKEANIFSIQYPAYRVFKTYYDHAALFTRISFVYSIAILFCSNILEKHSVYVFIILANYCQGTEYSRPQTAWWI